MPGKLIVAPSNEYALYELDVVTGNKKLLAGHTDAPGLIDGIGGQAYLSWVGQMENARNGKLRFLDLDYVREIDLTTRAVTTLSTGTIASFATADDDHLFVLSGEPLSPQDPPNLPAIYRFTVSTQALEPVIGNPLSTDGAVDGDVTTARLAAPSALVSDGAGGVVFFDSMTNGAPAMRTYRPDAQIVQTVFDSGGYGVRVGDAPSISFMSRDNVAVAGPRKVVLFDGNELVLLQVSY